MKTIVANLLISSFYCASLFNTPAFANSQPHKHPKSSNRDLSAKLFTYDKISTFSLNVNQINIDRNIGVKLKQEGVKINPVNDRVLSLKQQPFTQQNQKENLILGFQNTFWPSQNQKYWGLTTIEHFGKGHSEEKFNLSRLNYANEAPVLAPGNAVLTVSGGGNKDLVDRTTNSKEFEEFRGGVAYHQGLSDDVTVGVGFIYENLLQSFSQFTYQSDFLPLRTTVSLLTGERGLEVRSHIRLKPLNDLVVNYYNEPEKQRFDLNWAMLSGLNLTARGNSQQELLSAGLKVAAKNEYFSLNAKAELDNNNNWNWQLDSQLGNLQLVLAANKFKTQSEVNLNILDSLPVGFDCSLFFKYEIRQLPDSQKNLTIWGGSLHSRSLFKSDRYRWKFDLGYGYGSQGDGAILSTSVRLKPNLSLRVIYEEVSALSDDTNVKLQLAK
ncbi:hypothetical protein [Myxosarcina sp. GI1]|uniref:hypothetical protein n=1 Tax=Myxosarcina sp. GI1 TaxID=1541065 RepID=UPI00056C8960|nr:hypothetical protein [Myxosarcina sp. GI1]